MHTPRTTEEATSCGLLIVPNRLLGSVTDRVGHRTTPQFLQSYLIHRNKYKEAAKIGRQRNRPLNENKKENSSEELDEMEASSLSDRSL